MIREFFVKTTAVEGGDGVLAGLVFADFRAARRPEAVRREGPVRDAGPRGGLGHRHVARQLLQGRPLPRRGRPPFAPPALKKGQGVVYGTHGLGIKYEEWRDLFGSADIDAFHESCGITASSARTAHRRGELRHEGEER